MKLVISIITLSALGFCGDLDRFFYERRKPIAKKKTRTKRATPPRRFETRDSKRLALAREVVRTSEEYKKHFEFYVQENTQDNKIIVCRNTSFGEKFFINIKVNNIKVNIIKNSMPRENITQVDGGFRIADIDGVITKEQLANLVLTACGTFGTSLNKDDLTIPLGRCIVKGRTYFMVDEKDTSYPPRLKIDLEQEVPEITLHIKEIEI